MALEARFVQTARGAGALAAEQTLAAVAAELVARWAEPHRHYHDLAHLEFCLDEVEHDPVAALAAWGHDAVYDPRSPVNEERSALLLAGLLSRCLIPDGVIGQAMRTVRMTAGHQATTAAEELLADADLAVLARPWPDYMSYVDAVRREYAHVPDELWRAGRSVVLQRLLDLPAMFHHHPEREEPARANLRRELDLMLGAAQA